MAARAKLRKEGGAEGDFGGASSTPESKGQDSSLSQADVVENPSHDNLTGPSIVDYGVSDMDRVTALMDKGYVAYDAHRWHDAIQSFGDAEKLASKAMERAGLPETLIASLLNHRSRALGNVALTYETLGEHKLAIGAYKPCIEILEGRGDDVKAIKVLNNMGIAYMKLDDFKNALKSHQAMREKMEKVGSSPSEIALVDRRLTVIKAKIDIYGNAAISPAKE